MRSRQVFLLLVAIGGALVAGWAGPALWWLATECRAFCREQATSVQLAVAGNRSVLSLSRFAEGETASVEYVTTVLRDEPRLCAEVRDVFGALQAQGEFAAATKVIVSPTHRQPRFVAATWRGPVFSCCESTGVVFRHTGEGDWDVPQGLCKR